MNSLPLKTVIFIHGMWCKGSVSTSLGDAFNGLCEFHSPDLPEHCENPDLDQLRGCSFLDYVEFIHDFINNLPNQEERELILVGHSMGGLIAQKVAEEREVDGLVMLNSVAPAGINHIYIRTVYALRHVFRCNGLSRNGIHRPDFKHTRFGFFNRMEESLAQEFHENLVQDSGRCFSEMAFWWLDRKKATRIQNSVSGRKLIIGCGRDRTIRPIVAEKLRRRYPESDFRLFPNNGHWVFGEPNDLYIIEQIVNWIVEPVNAHHSEPARSKSNKTVQKVS